LKRVFFRDQASKMQAYEKYVCEKVKHVIAVSEIDAARIKSDFGAYRVSSVRTGVDTTYFAPKPEAAVHSDLLFCGSMDWLPNVDAVTYFVSEILPLIRAAMPSATFTIAGKSPDTSLLRAIAGVPGITLTGTVEDIRPYVCGARLSVVPLRIGGGTRLKIYESMAAGTPVISTTIGAEGLHYTHGKNLMIADTPREFADACIHLLKFEDRRKSLAREARAYVERELSWGVVTRDFEKILEGCARSRQFAEAAS
jgi:glycosyltransferase involved in cell wall biosynthesis